MPWWLVIIEAVVEVLKQLVSQGILVTEEHVKELVEHIKAFKK